MAESCLYDLADSATFLVTVRNARVFVSGLCQDS